MMIRSQRRDRGFTLIELVVVIAILVILAGGLLVKLDVLQLRANKGVSASDMASISRLMQTYVVTNNHYPDGFDSLVDATGPELYGQTLANADTKPDASLDQAGLDPQLVNGVGTTHQKVVLSTLTTGEVNSLGRMGITTLYDYNGATGFPSNRFNVARALAAGGQVAIINSQFNRDDAGALLTTGTDGDADDMMVSLYPQTNGQIPTGVRVVVFGLGPRCTLIGRNGMAQNAPLYANSSDRNIYYARDLVAFEVSAGGSRARFLGAFGADGDRLDEELTEFYEIQ